MKSFNELNEEIKNKERLEFESFIQKNKSEKRPILREYGLSYEERYVGRYSEKTGRVTFADRENPFTHKPICAKVLNTMEVSDGETVLVSLITFKYNERLTPENVFGCKIIRSLSAGRKEDKYGGLPVYTKKEIEEERQRFKEKENAQLEKNRKTYTEEFLSYLERCQQQHGFEPGFYHYTDFENFISIMKRGKVLSREALEKQGVEFHDSAGEKEIRRTKDLPLKSVRLFYGPKTPFLYVTEGIKERSETEHMANPVLLLFDLRIAYEKDVTYLDVSGSHISDEVKIKGNQTQDPKRAMRFDWDTILSRGSLSGVLNRGRVITQRNAEFLIPNCLETHFIKKIIFRSAASMKMARYLLGEDHRFITEEVMTCFNYDKDRIVKGRSYSINYLDDYDFTVVDDTIRIDLEFRTACTRLYRHSLELICSDSKKIIDISDHCNNSGYKVKLKIEDTEYLSVERINYYLNGHLSAVWIKGKEI